MLAKLNNRDRWQYIYQKDKYYYLINILFFNNELLELFRLYFSFLTFNYIYKINKFKLSLLNIIKHIAKNYTFTAKQAFF
jgi:hypothetical protein